MYVLPIAPETATAPDPAVLGLKAAGLVRMCRLGLPVPPALVLHRGLWLDVCGAEPGVAAASHRQRFFALWPSLWRELEPQLAQLQPRRSVDESAAAPKRPLVLAVRGGAAQSMPGMLASILNVGLHPAGLPSLATWAGSRRFALDCYARFLQQFCHAMLSADGSAADPRGDAWVDGGALSAVSNLTRRELRQDPPASDEALVAQAEKLRAEVTARTGVVLPDDLQSQLRWAIWGVLRSADAPRSRDYRSLVGLPADLGTAVVIQAMVYGNLDERSATGVLFTRDPSTGAKHSAGPGSTPAQPDAQTAAPYGEFLPCAQGEDVVGGTGLPQPLSELARLLPSSYAELMQHAATLERQLGDMQDIEFTIEHGVLWLLQARTGKRSAQAMVRIAADLAQEGVLSPAEALARIDAGRLVELLHPTLAEGAPRTRLARGLPASPGVAVGPIALSSAAVEAQVRAGHGRPPILVRIDTSPDDIVGIRLGSGVLTARGGLTSHAAVVARGLGRPAVVGASSLSIDPVMGTVSTREHIVQRGDILTIDGRSGDVLLGEAPLSVANLRENRGLQALLGMAATRRRLRTYATVEYAADLAMAASLGAEGLVLTAPRGLAGATLPSDASLAALPLLICLSADDVATATEATLAAIAPWLRVLQSARGAGEPLSLSFLWPLHAVADTDIPATVSGLRAGLGDRCRALALPPPGLGVALTRLADPSTLTVLSEASDQVVLSPSALLRAVASGTALSVAGTGLPMADWHQRLAAPLAEMLSVLRRQPTPRPIGICDLDSGATAVHPAAVAFCAQQDLTFFAAPPLRLPLVSIAAAQVAVS